MNKTLEIFDFDGTLFANPMPSHGLWKKGVYGKLQFAWYQHAETLDLPYVPEVPGDEWWNAEVVERALEVAADPDRVGVMMTGRRRKVFWDAVKRILDSKGLNYDVFSDFRLKPEQTTTFKYKTDALDEMVQTYGADRVILHDDRIKHVQRFNKYLEKAGINGECRHVDWKFKTLLTEEQELEIGRIILDREGVEYD